MRINNSFPVGNYINYSCGVQKNRVFNTPLPNDQFIRSNEVSFNGTLGGVGRFKNAPDLIFLSKVDSSYAFKLIKEIGKQPKDILKKIKEENYKILITPTLKKAYETENIYDPAIFLREYIDPLDILAAVYTQGKHGKNFLAFCDKPPYSIDYMKEIVDKGFAYSLVHIDQLNEKTNRRPILTTLTK